MSAVDVTNQGGTMSEYTIRDLGRAAGHPDADPGCCIECGYDGDALEGELERLRSEVERLRRRESIAIDQRDAALQRAESAGVRERDERRARDRALARRDVLRARLAKVAGIAPAVMKDANGRLRAVFYPADVHAALAFVPEPSDSECGGCKGIGSHRRWCESEVGRRASFLGGLSVRADDLADVIGSNCPEAANACYQAASLLRRGASEPAANPRGDDRETASEPAPDAWSEAAEMDRAWRLETSTDWGRAAPDADRVEVWKCKGCGSGLTAEELSEDETGDYCEDCALDADREAGER